MHTARDFTGRQVQPRCFLAQLPGIQRMQVRTKVTVMRAAAFGQPHVPHVSWAALLNLQPMPAIWLND